MLAVVAEYDRFNLSVCVYCGQVLAAIKMPGGQLPWDTDVDAPHYAADFYQALANVVPRLKVHYGLGSKVVSSRHVKNENGELEGGAITINHPPTHFTVDNYAKAPSKLHCGRQQEKGRARTLIRLGGSWVPGPDNPGKYGRTYGDEILQHVLHVVSKKQAYGNIDAKFKK